MLLVLSFFVLVYQSSKAQADFGWRIFKLCGTNLEKKHMIDKMLRLRAWVDLDLVLSLQQCARHARRPPPATSRPPATRPRRVLRLVSARRLTVLAVCAWRAGCFSS